MILQPKKYDVIPAMAEALICDVVGISVQRLTKMFQDKYGMPVGEYDNTCRVDKAKDLLKETDLTVS